MYEQPKWCRGLRVAASVGMTYSIIKDMSQTVVSPLYPWTAPGGGHLGMTPRANGTLCRSYALKITGTGGGAEFRSASLQVEIDSNFY